MVDRRSRRAYLRSGATLGAFAAAGCLGVLDAGSDGDGSAGDAGDDSDATGPPTNGTDDAGAETDGGNETDADGGADTGGEEPPTVVEDWPQFQYDAQNTGYVDAIAPRDLEESWSHELDVEVASSPVVADGTLYVSSKGGTVAAFDARSGSVEWQTSATSGQVDTSVDSFPSRCPALSDDLLIVPNSTGMHGLDRSSGEIQWQIAISPDEGPSSPTIHDGTAYFGDRQHRFYAVDAATGEVEWTIQGTQYRHYYPYAPVVDGDRLFAYAGSDVIDEIDRISGERWPAVTSTDDQDVFTAPSLANDTIYYGGEEGGIFAYELGDRYASQLWQDPHDREVNVCPVVGDGKIFFTVQEFQTSDGALYALDASDGTELWSHTLEVSDFAAPVVVGDTLYHSDTWGTFSVYDAETGSRLREFDASFPESSDVAAVDQSVFLIGEQGKITALIGNS